MWTRKSVKEKGKKAFLGNFWKCVLVAIILSVAIGAASSGFSSGSSVSSTFSNIINSAQNGSSTESSVTETEDEDASQPVTFDIDLADPASADPELVSFMIGVVVVGTVIYIIITAFALAFKYFLMTPFEYGCRMFFR